MAEAAETKDHTGERIKHLELIQDVIARMSGNTATIKRYAVIITAAAISFAKAASTPVILVFTAAIVLIFALLDARYLRLERCFRDLYDEVRKEPSEQRPDFRLSPPANGRTMLQAAWSWSVAGLYAALVLFMLALIPFLRG